MGQWKASIREFRELRVLTACGLLAALAIVLNYTTTINIGPTIKIGFSGLPNQLAAYLFGPAVGMIFGGVLDVLKWALRPDGAFFPGFTLSAMIGGAIYGMLLYKKPVKIWRVLLAHFLINAFVNVGLNTFWLVLLYEKSASVILPARITKNLVMLPIDTVITYVMLRFAEKSLLPILRRSRQESRTGQDAPEDNGKKEPFDR